MKVTISVDREYQKKRRLEKLRQKINAWKAKQNDVQRKINDAKAHGKAVGRLESQLVNLNKQQIDMEAKLRSVSSDYPDSYVVDFNAELEKAAKKMTISGNKITYIQGDSEFRPSFSELSFTMAGVVFNINFLDHYASKPAVVVQISSEAKPGVIEKKVTGKNVDPKWIISKLDNFFKTGGKW